MVVVRVIIAFLILVATSTQVGVQNTKFNSQLPFCFKPLIDRPLLAASGHRFASFITVFELKPTLYLTTSETPPHIIKLRIKSSFCQQECVATLTESWLLPIGWQKTNDEITGVAVVDSDSVIACGHRYDSDAGYNAILLKVCVPCFIRGRTQLSLATRQTSYSKIHKENV